MAKMHLTLTVTQTGVVARGDTYGARDALARAGYRARKVGHEWEWVRTIASAEEAMAAVRDLGRELYGLARPTIERHLAAAKAGGFPARPEDYAWTITVAAGSREAYYIALSDLIPARPQNGRLEPVRI